MCNTRTFELTLNSYCTLQRDESQKRLLGEMILTELHKLSSSDEIGSSLLCLYDLYLPSLMEGFALKNVNLNLIPDYAIYCSTTDVFKIFLNIFTAARTLTCASLKKKNDWYKSSVHFALHLYFQILNYWKYAMDPKGPKIFFHSSTGNIFITPQM